MDKPSKTRGIITLLVAIVAIIVMIAVNGLLGLILYLFAAAISFLSIDKGNRNTVSALINYIKNTVCNTHKETLLSNDIFAIIIALFPVILLISCFMIFYIDPLRAAEIRQPILKLAHYKNIIRRCNL